MYALTADLDNVDPHFFGRASPLNELMEMVESFVNFFICRLDSLLLQEAESFTGFEDDVQQIMGMLREIASFFAESGSIVETDAFRSWTHELKKIINEMDDYLDKFIIQMEIHDGSDQQLFIDSTRVELQMTGSCLADAVLRMRELNNSMKGEEREDKSFHGMDEGETSASSFKLQYTNLPYHLQTCLTYCCIFPENYWINKGRLIRLLIAEGLIQGKAGEIIEDIAQENINELISLGMLQVVDHPGNGIKLVVPSHYREVLASQDKGRMVNYCMFSVHCVSIHSDMKQVEHTLNEVRIRSLFLFHKKAPSRENWNWLNLYGSKFLRVLDLEDSKIKHLPDEVGDLMHLRYLGLKHTDINELPETLGNLRALQTLDIRWCGNLTAVPKCVLNLLRLRHLKMFKSRGFCGMDLPKGIGRIKCLLTLTGVNTADGISRELGSLVQLRRLGVMNVSEDDASELYISIMMMKELLCLSLKAKSDISSFDQGRLTLLETFIPPPLLRKLCLEGVLERIPNWLGMMDRLTNLRLGHSHLSENPTSVLQLLPNLKNLTLWRAFEAKHLGKEFFKAGGFPKLEDLTIVSHVIEEWTELEEGALPSLKFLRLHNCLQLKMLPEGLQFITTLKQLCLMPLLDDHEERLRPDGGVENYKIKHIPVVKFITMSAVNQISLFSRGAVKNEE